MNTKIYNIEENSSKNNQLFFVKFIEGFFMKRLSTFLVLLVMLLAFTTSSWAATLKVPLNYSTIQAAVNAASGGDVVEVSNGTYTENVTIPGGKNGLSVVAAAGNSPVLEGAALGSHKVGFRIYSDFITIKGFTIQNYNFGGATDVYTNTTVRGAGIESMIATYQHVFENNTITNCNWGILVSEGNNITVKNNTISNIVKTTAGTYLTEGGIGISFISSAVAMEHNLIRNNTLTNAARAGIVYGRLGGSVGADFTVIDSNKVQTCTTTGAFGYAIFNILTKSPVKFSNNTSEGNYAGLYIDNMLSSDNDDVSIMWNNFNNTISTIEVQSSSLYAGFRLYDIMVNTRNVFDEGTPATNPGAIAALEYTNDAVVNNGSFKYIRNTLVSATGDAVAYETANTPADVRVFVMDGKYIASVATVNLAASTDKILVFGESQNAVLVSPTAASTVLTIASGEATVQDLTFLSDLTIFNIQLMLMAVLIH
jgi:parallel beta-helix repeat protein